MAVDTRFRRFVPACLGLSLWSACGIGSEVLLGRFKDLPALDAGDTDAGDLAPTADASADAGLEDGGDDAGMVRPECVVPAERTPVPCTRSTESSTFSPRVKWRFPPASLDLAQDSPPGTPLVANLTDDNDDGRVDLCDIPDVVVTAGSSSRGTALWILAGDTGRVEQVIDQPLLPGVAPAIGDLDGDGVPEIVAIDENGRLVAFRPDGSVFFHGAEVTRLAEVRPRCYAISIYDIDADGSPEILAGFEAFDALGSRRFGAGTYLLGLLNPAVFNSCLAPIAHDLDGDGKLEVLFGHETWSASGKMLWRHSWTPSIPVVGNFDADPELEIALTTPTSLVVLNADGTEITSLLRACGGNAPSVQDFDGDGVDELAVPGCDPNTRAAIYGVTATGFKSRWSADNVLGTSNFSGTASFDFGADKRPSLLYADTQSAAMYDGSDGRLLFEGVRTEHEFLGTPVIVDVDNDGHADLLVPAFESGASALLTVLENEGEGFLGTRRIWNQHAYHVTNVHEDGRIPRGSRDAPQVAPRMRSNALAEGNRLCVP